MSTAEPPRTGTNVADINDILLADASSTAAIIDQGCADIILIPSLYCSVNLSPPVACCVDQALEIIRPQSSGGPAETSRDHVFALEIESFSCCMRGQADHLAVAKTFVAALSCSDGGIESWTGYSTVLSILCKLLRKVRGCANAKP